MSFAINERGLLFLKRRKKTINQYIFLSPFAVGLMSILFILSARSQGQMYVGIFFLVVLVIMILAGFFKNLNTVNNMISNITTVDENRIKIKTYKILFYKSKEVFFNKNEVKFKNEEIIFTLKEKEDGCKILLRNGKSYYLVWSHFSPELKELLSNKN